MHPRSLPGLARAARLTEPLQAELLSGLVNHLLRHQAFTAGLDYLDGKRLWLCLTDVPLCLKLRIVGRRLRPSQDRTGWDVRIRGSARNLWRLASRAEDPDTLFFNRELTLEGDTDAALYLKNLLDAAEFDLQAHLQGLLGPRLAGPAAGLLRRLPVPGPLRRALRIS